MLMREKCQTISMNLVFKLSQKKKKSCCGVWITLTIKGLSNETALDSLISLTETANLFLSGLKSP
jgi:hypothetical protein